MTPKILIAGGGPAAIEAVLALADHGLTPEVLAPDPVYSYRPLSVAEPFAESRVRTYKLTEVLTEGVKLHEDALARVDRPRRTVETASGRRLEYDILLIAMGAKARPGIEHAITFAGVGDVETLHGLVQDVEQGYANRVAFVVPEGASWTLPLYELALQMAKRIDDLGLSAELLLATPEARPLEIFGAEASELVEGLLSDAGITLHAGVEATSPRKGAIRLHPNEDAIEAGRIVALHLPVGPDIPGLPSDLSGFLPVDAHQKLSATDEVYAAGDVTAFHIKQGGLATQQADVAALAIARQAGVEVEVPPFVPVLRSVLLDGKGSWYFMRALDGEDPGTVSREPLWNPPTKIAGRRLSGHLDQLDEGDSLEARLARRAH